jgi:hypothetical protein
MRLFTTMMAAVVIAQTAGSGGQSDPRRRDEQGPQAVAIRKLESVSWNPATRELTWVVSKATRTSKNTVKDTYIIRVDQALMKFEGERRGFDPKEARSVQTLLNLLSRYAVESTVWWEQGQGIKLDDRVKPGLRVGGTPTEDQAGRAQPSLTAARDSAMRD